MRRWAIRLFGVGALLALAVVGAPEAAAGGGCHVSGESTEAAGTAVSLKNCGFAPVVLHAPVGGTITWKNEDYLPHGVHGISWGLKEAGDVLVSGASFQHRFTAPGIYPYMCYVHPGMSGVVLVGDVAAAPAAGAPPAMVAAATESSPSSTLLAGALGIGGVLVGYALSALRRSRAPRAVVEARSN